MSASPRVTPGTVWTPLGPAPLASDASGLGVQDYGLVAGRATAVAVDPADGTGNTVYVGGAYGGVWKSTNAGPASANPSSVTWTPLTDDQATLAVGAIAIQPQLTSPDASRSVILVGTGETNNSSDSYYGLGILRSANAGNTWTLISQDSSGNRLFAGLASARLHSARSTRAWWWRLPRAQTRAWPRGSKIRSAQIAGFTTRTTADSRELRDRKMPAS